MRLFIFILSVSFIAQHCIAQEDSIIDIIIEEVQLEDSIDLPEISFLDYIAVEDSYLKDEDLDLTVVINDSSLYQFKDSCLLNGILCVYLSKAIFNCIEVNNSYTGKIIGEIEKGKKEGKWIETSYGYGSYDIVAKQLNFKNGLLDGDYFVYNTEAKTKYDSIRSWEDSTKYFYTTKGEIISPNKNSVTGAIGPTSSFENGTGLYLDYYNDTGILKEKGWLKHGQREGRWCLYDTEGKLIKVDIYRHGNCITDF